MNGALKRWFLYVHKLGAKCGIYILPAHYYVSVPNLNDLDRNREWARPSEMPGIAVDLDAQLDRLKLICCPLQKEYTGNPHYKTAVAQHYGPGFGFIEAQVLHSVIRSLKPKRIVEVGCGATTYCMVKAGAKELTAIEPYPSKHLEKLPITLIRNKVQRVDVRIFEQLERGDFLSIDTTHTVMPGSDANYIILEVLPRLKPGVIVHFHDIFFPYDYHRDTLQTFMHWSETALLHALLVNNQRFKILFSLSHLHHERKEELKAIFLEYDPEEDQDGLRDARYRPFEASGKHFPSSCYLQVE